MNPQKHLVSPLGAILALTIGVAALIAGGGHATPAKADAAANGAFDFGAATYPVTEGGTAYIVVNRSQGSAGTQTVQYSLVFNGTANAADLSGFSPAPGNLTFGPGQTSRTIDAGSVGSGITTFDDGDNEGTETVTFTITGVTGGGVIGSTQPSTTLSITDNDGSPTYSYASATYSPAESAGVVNVQVTRSGATGGTNTVDCTRTGGTATGAGTDFTFNTQTITFNPGDTSKNCQITIVQDGLIDPGETIIFGFASPSSGFGAGSITSTTVTIVDDDGAGQFQFASGTYSVSEAGGSITLYVNRINGSTGIVTVNYATSDVSATSGSDYTGVSNTLTFGAGVTQMPITVTILQDVSIEGSQTFNVTLSGPSAGTSIVGTNPSVVTILDDDSGSAPVVYSVSPNVGPVTGLVGVTITGANLSSATSVTFGGSSYPAFITSNSSTTIIANAPAHYAATVHVQVTTAFGTSATSANDWFTYGGVSGLPVIYSVNPTSGPVTGFTYFTLTGTNFTGANVYGGVTFGGTVVTTFSVVNNTTITGYTPAHVAGLVQVRVTNGVGTSLDNYTYDDYTYTGTSPVVSSLSPTSGPVGGGTSVVITGSGFTGATSVSFGGTTTTSFAVNSDGQITVTSPAHAAATVSVFVTVGSVTSPEAGTADNFTYTSTGAHSTYALSFRWNLLVWLGADGVSAESALKGLESPDDSLTNNVFSTVTAIFRWNASGQRWLAFYPSGVGVPGANDFTTLGRYSAYWVAVSTGTNWTIATP